METSAREATKGWWEAAEEGDGAPDRLAEDDGGGAGAGDADKGVERHGDGKTEGLAEDLRVLRLGVAGEVRDVE